MATTIKLRRDISTNWTNNNPILALGEPGVETDTLKLKIGNGSDRWRDLNYITYTLPTATTSVLGGVKVDGTTISINNGVISSTTGSAYVLPTATTSLLGGVKVDGTTITISDGVITAVGAGGGGTGTVNSGTARSLAYYPSAGTTVDDIPNVSWNSSTTTLAVAGILTATTLSGTLNVSNLTGTISSSLLPIASASVLGGVKVDGTSITISNGTISSLQYTLPTATTSVLGGVKVDGTTITISGGTISSLQYTLPTATTSVLGGVKVDGTTITINNGVITAVGGGGGGGTGTVNSGTGGSLTYYPTTGTTVDDLSSVTWNSGTSTLSVSGIVSATTLSGTLNVSNLTGTISSSLLPTATTSTLGAVKVDGTSITISSGTISATEYVLPTATTSVLGGVKIDGTTIKILGGVISVNNGVFTTTSYANPSWITSLDGGKLTGTVVATNGVVTSGSYANPSWITALDYSKISTPSSLSITATSSTTARSLATRFATVFDVKDFGATGDGTTNDYTAIAAALTAAGNVTGGAVVLVANGTFAVNSTLNVPRQVTLKIQSATIKNGTGFTASNPLISLDAGSPTYPDGQGACIEGESTVNSIISYTGSNYAVKVTASTGVTQGCQANISNVKIIGSSSGAAGIYYKWVTVSNTNNVMVKGFTNGDGVYHTDTYAMYHYGLQCLNNKVGVHNNLTNAINFIGGSILNNTQYGWWDEYNAAAPTTQNTITNSTIENNGGTGTAQVRLSFCYMFSLTNNYFETNNNIPSYNVWIDNNSYSVNIISNSFTTGGTPCTYTIYNQAGFATTVRDNLCRESSTVFYYQAASLQYNRLLNNTVLDFTNTKYIDGSDSNNDTIVVGLPTYIGTPSTFRNAQGATQNGYGFNILSGYGQDLVIRTRSSGSYAVLIQDKTASNNLLSVADSGQVGQGANVSGFAVNLTNTSNTGAGYQVNLSAVTPSNTLAESFFYGQINGTGKAAIYSNGGYVSFAGAFGYGTGAGSAVTVSGTGTGQTVTINKSCGTITCASAAGSTAVKTVTVTNSFVVATDTIVISGQGGSNPYASYVYAVGAGTFKFDYYSPSGTATETPKFNFAIMKAVSA